MMDAKDWRAVRIEQLEAENTSRKAELAAAQAKIDRLMLEFCPEEMTEEQTDEWARSQQPAHFPFSADRVTHHKIEIAVLEAQEKQEPVACPDKGPWSEGKTDDGRVYIESEDFEHDVRLYVDGDFAEGDCKHYAERMAAWMNAAPVVQPDMVMVPREPTEAMLDAAMNRYQHVSPEAKARYTQMHRENFRCDYRAMIAACEDKS